MADPKECRRRAEACIDRANTAKDVAAQRIFFDAARGWFKIAKDLERACGLTDGEKVVAPQGSTDFRDTAASN